MGAQLGRVKLGGRAPPGESRGEQRSGGEDKPARTATATVTTGSRATAHLPLVSVLSRETMGRSPLHSWLSVTREGHSLPSARDGASAGQMRPRPLGGAPC